MKYPPTFTEIIMFYFTTSPHWSELHDRLVKLPLGGHKQVAYEKYTRKEISKLKKFFWEKVKPDRNNPLAETLLLQVMNSEVDWEAVLNELVSKKI